MDTNLISILAKALVDQPKGDNSTITIVMLIIAAVTPLITAVALSIQSRAQNAKAEKAIEQVHTAVNSERTAMIHKLDTLTAEILRISKEKSTLEEHQRGAEKSKSASQTGPVPVQIVADEPVPVSIAEHKKGKA